MNMIAEREPFDQLPEDVTLDRESRQQRVRAVLMTYCQPKFHGQTAWEIASKILGVLDEGGSDANQ